MKVIDLSELGAYVTKAILNIFDPIQDKCLGLCIGNHEQKAMTQKSEILRYMQAQYVSPGAAMSPYVAFKLCGCLRLSQRIIELEQDGWRIIHAWQEYVSHRKFVRVMTYRLASLKRGKK